MSEEYKEIIVACINDHPQTMVLLRRAASLAKRKGLGWTALHIVETHQQPSSKKDNQEQRLRLLQNLHLAEEMGAEIKTVNAPHFKEGMRGFITEQTSKTRMVIFLGTAHVNDSWIGFLIPNKCRIVHSMLPAGSHVELVRYRVPVRTRSVMYETIGRFLNIREILTACLMVALATIAILVLQEIFVGFQNSPRNRTMVYIIACVFVSLRYGLIPGLLSSVLSFFAMNYAFETVIIPTNIAKDLAIDSPPMLVSFWLYVMCSVVVNVLAGRSHNVVSTLKQRIEQLIIPQRLYSESLKENEIQSALASIYNGIKKNLNLETAFFLPAPFNPERVEIAYPAGMEFAQEDMDALACCWREFRVTGAGTLHYSKALYCFRPLLTPEGARGVLGTKADTHFFESHDISGTLAGIADVTALVIERLHLTQQMQDGRVREEKERLRSTLLSSISHDLKTPLASVVGSLTALQDMKASLQAEQKDILLQTALDEARRLDGFITNILEMTRLESGQVVFKENWVSAFDIISNVYGRMRAKLRGRIVQINDNCLRTNEVCIDAFLVEQVIQNIFDNILKYTPSGTSIDVWGEQEENLFCIHIRDHGKGIPEDQVEKIFDKYHRLNKQDTNVAGTGLGLAIARIIMRAQGGNIRATNHPDGGAVFILCFSNWRAMQMDARAAE